MKISRSITRLLILLIATPSSFATFNKRSSTLSFNTVNEIAMIRQRKPTPIKKAVETRGGSDSQPINPSTAQEVKPLINESTEKKVAKDVSKEHSPSKLRAAVFPIYGDEVSKFLLMGAIKFFVIMALTLTRDTKDTLVVTQCGAEAIAFLKVCVESLFYCILDICFLIHSSHRFMEFCQQRQDL